MDYLQQVEKLTHAPFFKELIYQIVVEYESQSAGLSEDQKKDLLLKCLMEKSIKNMESFKMAFEVIIAENMNDYGKLASIRRKLSGKS